MPPPPQARRVRIKHRPPPPPPPADETPPDRSPLMDDLDYTFAVMTFGQFPELHSWEDAERETLRLVRERTPFRDISAASIWYLMKEYDNVRKTANAAAA